MNRCRTSIQTVVTSTKLGGVAGSTSGAILTVLYVCISVLLAFINAIPSGRWLPVWTTFLLFVDMQHSVMYILSGTLVGCVCGLVYGMLNGCGIAVIVGRTRDLFASTVKRRIQISSLLVTGGVNLLLLIGTGGVKWDESWITMIGIPILVTLPCAWWASSRLTLWLHEVLTRA